MAKIARKNMKIFGVNAGAQQRGVFGSLAAGLPAYSTDPETIQSLSNYEDGWFGAVLGNNSPAIQDMNALQFLFAYQLAYGFQSGIPEWNDETTYYIGSLVNDAGTVYVSIADDNLNNAVSDESKWSPYSTEPVGSMKPYVGPTAPRGWVLGSGRTIGSGASGATERANADTLALYTLLWDNYANTILVIQDSSGSPTTRGANAAADFAANKRMPLPDLRGRVPAGKDNMGGSAASRLTSTTVTPDGNTLGASGGAQTHTLSTTEIPSHNHTQDSHNHSQNSHTHSIPDTGGTMSNGSLGNIFWRGLATTQPGGAYNINSTTATNNATTATNQATGGGGAHNNVQPTWVVNYIIKL